MSPCEGEGSRCKSSREQTCGRQYFIPPWQSQKCTSFVKKTMPVRFRPEDPILLPYAVPGDDVASSIQACEACRVGASPTHLTPFVPLEQRLVSRNHSVCKTDATGALPVGTSNFHSIQAEIALRSVGNGQKVGASPAGGSALSQRRQVASHLAHNQKAVGSIPAAATFHAPWSNSLRRLSHKEETVGQHHPERFHLTGSAY